MDINAVSSIKSVQLTGRIVKADGTVVELGQLATWHRNPVVNAWRRLKHFLKR